MAVGEKTLPEIYESGNSMFKKDDADSRISAVPLHIASLKGRFGNSNPAQIAPRPSVTVT